MTDQSLFALLILLGPVFLILGKRFLTEPRLGYVRFNPHRLQKLRTIRLITAGASLLTLGLFIAVVMGAPPARSWTAPILTLGITSLLLAVAWYLDFKRMYLYALLIGCAVARNEYACLLPGGAAFLAAGIYTLVIALLLLFRFVHKYPRINNQEPLQGNNHAHS